MKTLRTPDERFENLPGYPFAPHYTDVPDGEGGTLRVHHVDEGPADGPVVLCMHGQPTWSYLYRHMIPLLNARGLRVLAPDLVGYGRSDKPAAREDYSYQRQVDWMTAWMVANDLAGATFFGQDWGGLIGLRMVAENAERFERVVVSNTGLPAPVDVPDEVVEEIRRYRAEAPTPTIAEVMGAIANPGNKNPMVQFAYWQKWCWETEDLPVSMAIVGIIDGRETTAEEARAYDAPLPDPSYKMGPRAMPSHVPTLPDDPSVEANLKAWEVFRAWKKPFVTAFTDNDAVTAGMHEIFEQLVPGAAGRSRSPIAGGGHFVQEGRAEELSKIIAECIESD